MEKCVTEKDEKTDDIRFVFLFTIMQVRVQKEV